MNILIVGVGGQGTLLAAKVLGECAALQGYEVKLSEVHGMSQRGGSVVTHVRFGTEIHTPVIWEGGADVVLAFEPLEALRYAHYLTKEGKVLTNSTPLPPMSVATGLAAYPDVPAELAAAGIAATYIPATDLALAAGSIKCVNMVMIGALTKAMGLDYDVMQTAVRNTVKKALDMNLEAVRLGYIQE